MLVSELVEKLKEMPQDMEVYFVTDNLDNEYEQSRQFRLKYLIEYVDVREHDWWESKEGEYVKLESGW